eukprot:3122976-Ditylum_brightwellii.AAC.1
MYQKQTDLIDVHIRLLNYSHDHQYSFEHWQNIVNVVIAKDVGFDKIYRLHILHLYEADYSLSLGLNWQELVATAKQRQLLNCSLYGRYKGYNAKTILLIEELKYGISYSLRKALINFDIDAASCYDRILPNVSGLAVRKLGMHKSVTFVHATTLKQANFFLKTALGVSDEYYQHCKLYPIYSSGQGATNSPQ